MIRVGILGMGFMGWIHWLAYQKIEGIEVVAICTKEKHRLEGDWTDIKGNFGPPGEKVDLSGIKTYEDAAELFADESVDLIDICLPPSLHSPMICQAAAAGKPVFCEKPLALNVEDCDKAVSATQASAKMLLVGHVLPFFPEYQFARDLIDSKKFGNVQGGSFKRVISDPQWLKNFYDPTKIGGPLYDLHVHDAHFIRLLFGMPKSLVSTGRQRGEVVEYCNTIFRFEDPSKAVTSTMGVINQQGRPFTHGFEIHLEKATLQFEFAAFSDGAETMVLKVFHPDGSVERPELGDGDPVLGFVAEIEEVKRSLESGEPSPILGGQLARDAIKICDAQTLSVFEKREVELA